MRASEESANLLEQQLDALVFALLACNPKSCESDKIS